MLKAGAGTTESFEPQMEGAIVILTKNGEQIIAFPGTILFNFALRQREEEIHDQVKENAASNQGTRR
jgi:hypothetical protein